MALLSDVNGRIFQSYVDPGDGTAAMQVVVRQSGTIAFPNSANLMVTGTAAAGTGVTLTLPAVASKFHYIVAIEIQKFAAAVLVAAATPVIVTTTNLNGIQWILDSAADAQGALAPDPAATYAFPLKSAVVNTNTTIVAPATTSVIWNLNCYYFVAP